VTPGSARPPGGTGGGVLEDPTRGGIAEAAARWPVLRAAGPATAAEASGNGRPPGVRRAHGATHVAGMVLYGDRCRPPPETAVDQGPPLLPTGRRREEPSPGRPGAAGLDAAAAAGPQPAAARPR
jgi:hypothetical protein